MGSKSSSVRVLIVHPRDLGAPTIGGIQTFLHDFVKFSPADFEIVFAGVTQDPVSRPIGRITRIAIDDRSAWFLPFAPVGAVPRNPLRLLAMAFAQMRVRREMLRRGTILQVHRPYRRLLLAGHRGPRVQFVHVDIREWPGPSAWSRLQGAYRQFSDAALEQMDRVFVVNEPGVHILRGNHPKIADRIEFLPGWFDEAVFRPALRGEAPDIRRALLGRLGLNASAGRKTAQDRLILFAGRFEAIKDPELAVDAFAELIRSTDHPARLLFAGDGTMRQQIQDRANELGIADRIHVLGDLPREELADVMRGCDAMLLTARAEGGGPRVVLEALACGIPVVAAPVGDVRRTVKHRVNGWLFEVRSPSAVSDGLKWILEQPAKSLADAATAAAAPYTARAVLAGLYQKYRLLSVKA